MSLAGALYNAYSGLTANARNASVVSTNISNATTESYGRRELVLTPGALGTTGGVRTLGVFRNVDPVLISDRMVSDARLGYANSIHGFHNGLENTVGESGTLGSLTDRVNQFESALLTAASNPSSAQRLEMVATTATDLARDLNSISDHIQATRLTADTEIGRQVTRINDSMKRLEQINLDIRSAIAHNGDTATLEDERQKILDDISEFVPLRVVRRDFGEIAVFTMNGGTLLDGRAQELGFDRSLTVEAGDTVAGGVLSGLTLNGNPTSVSGNGMFAGGKLAAQFEIRDVIAVEKQATLDGVARDLIERLGSGGPDTTLGPTDPGLFTDSGFAFDPLNETGISARIELNGLVAPGSNEVWRLRDGLGAAAPGEVGDSRLLQGIATALTQANAPASASLATASRGFADHISEFSSDASGDRVRAENEMSYQTSQNTALSELVLANGVDTDQELQTLMQIEQLYSANAKVMTVVDDLLERLMSI
ncbi:MAG: flagellar hook-associated protein FlgK [Pelagimonas sp.]|jgi:flagellar hook-associated protein 1 FlgK|nr:flagellar hook-associated protein FlgK [Pelagimonas sp.]